MDSENEYSSTSEEELDEKYLFPHGRLLYPLPNKEEYIKRLDKKYADTELKIEKESSDEEESNPNYLLNGIRLLYPIKDREAYENNIKKYNSDKKIIKKNKKSLLYNHNFLNHNEMEIIEKWKLNKDCLEDWYDEASIEKYFDIDKYINYKRNYENMILNQYNTCIHSKKTIECNICSIYYYCRSCSVMTANKKYRLYCKECFIKKFPNELVFKKVKTREQTVINFITKEFKDLNWIINKPIETLKVYPDVFLEMEDKYLIIEIDEHQHKKYNKRSEEERIQRITSILEDKTLFMIRFNTDEFIDNNGVENSSPWWKYNQDLVIKNEKEWNRRLKKLYENINYILNVNNTNLPKVNINYLFYDGSKSNLKTLIFNSDTSKKIIMLLNK